MQPGVGTILIFLCMEVFSKGVIDVDDKRARFLVGLRCILQAAELEFDVFGRFLMR